MTRHRPRSTSDPSPANRFGRPGAVVAALLALAVASTLLAAAPAPEVTPANGPSWLTVLGAPFERTSLGRLGVLGNERSDLPSPSPDLASAVESGFTVAGEDLYRYNCRSCHGAKGAGLPPQVRPLTWAIKATSPTLQHRLAPDDEAATEAAGRAEQAVRYRISRGGTAMPAFEHFSPDEVEALFSYLEQLAEVPDPQHEGGPLPCVLDGEEKRALSECPFRFWKQR